MAEMSVQGFEKLKEQIETAKRKKAQAEGARDERLIGLKELGCPKGLESIPRRKKDLQKKIQNIDTELDGIVKDLEKDYGFEFTG